MRLLMRQTLTIMTILILILVITSELSSFMVYLTNLDVKSPRVGESTKMADLLTN